MLLDSGFTIDEALNLIALQRQLESAAAREQPWILPIERGEGPLDHASLN
jgi:hypothetical protein